MYHSLVSRRMPGWARVGLIVLLAAGVVGVVGPASFAGGSRPSNTSPPTISGTKQQGYTLTGTTGTWTNSPTSYAYSWLRCNSSGAQCAAISGATASTYLLVAADVGKTIKLNVTATNSAGSTTASSAATTVIVAAVAPSNTALPSISGTAMQAQQLTGASGTWSGSPPPTYTYQWRRCDTAGANCTNISNATGSTYTAAAADVGATLRLQVTASNVAGSSTATSNQTATVVPPPPGNSTLPAITGTPADGQTLTVSNGSWTNAPTSYAYQWRRCDTSGGACSDINGATTSTYPLVSVDVGATVRAVVTATNAGGSGSATSAQTSVVSGVAPSSTAAPTISGELEEGKIVTASTGTWSGTTPMNHSYTWRRCLGGSCSDIAGANSSTYTLTADDVAADVQVNVQATNGVGSAAASDRSGSVASPTVTALPYRDPALADQLWTLLKAKWPNAFSAAERALTASPLDIKIKTGLWRARVAAKVLPPLGSSTSVLTWRDPATGSWGHGWKIYRYTAPGSDVKWVHLYGEPGFGAFVPNTQPNYVDSIRWEHWCGTNTQPPCSGGVYDSTPDPHWMMDFHRATYGWHIGRFPDMTNAYDGDCFYWQGTYTCPWGSSPELREWHQHLWTLNTTTPLGGALARYPAPGQPCQIWMGNVTCYVRVMSDAEMEQRIGVDDFADYTTQAVDMTVGVPESSFQVPSTPILEPVRAVLDGEKEAREWVNKQLSPKPWIVTPPLTLGFANQGETLNGTRGEWYGDTTTRSLHWLRCNATGGGCVDLYGAVGSQYTLSALDVGSTMRFKVTVANANGAATATSDPTPVVLAPISELARGYRPAMLFDSTEHYRPISVDSLLVERLGGGPAHKRCYTAETVSGDLYDPPCDFVGSVSELVAPSPYANTVATWLSIWPYQADAQDYRSPDCPASSNLRDCGNIHTIYYDYGQSINGYRFIDYWLFYRYNPFSGDDHEGDWEGLTVELNPGPAPTPPVNGILLAQHNKLMRRLPDAFYWCENGVQDWRTCAFSPPPPAGEAHPAIFVAEGSHASYEYQCETNCDNPALPFVNEHRHDGTAGWAENGDAACAVIACLRTFGAEWVAWPGKWGGSGVIPRVGNSPDSPGSRENDRYTCTQAGWACSKVPDEGGAVPFGRAAPSSARRLRNVCETWFDRALAAFACSQDQVRAGTHYRESVVSRPLTLHVRRHKTATAPGIVQVVGVPLKERDVVQLRGKPARDVIVVLNYLLRGREYLVRLRAIRTASRSSVRVELVDGKPRVILRRLRARMELVPVRR